MNFDEINEATGFANRALFESVHDVKIYFTIENMIFMFNECSYSQQELDDMAKIVIENNWHLKYPLE